jgi:hypothetical protein
MKGSFSSLPANSRTQSPASERLRTEGRMAVGVGTRTSLCTGLTSSDFDDRAFPGPDGTHQPTRLNRCCAADAAVGRWPLARMLTLTGTKPSLGSAAGARPTDRPSTRYADVSLHEVVRAVPATASITCELAVTTVAAIAAAKLGACKQTLNVEVHRQTEACRGLSGGTPRLGRG